METKTRETEVSAVKKSYEAPVLKEWGTLKDITLAHSSGGKSDGGNKAGVSRTN